MQRCPVCGNTGATFAVCPVCGFEESLDYESCLSLVPLRDAAVLSVSGRRAAWERAQKRRQLSELEILAETYYYTVGDDTPELARTEELLLVRGEALRDGEIAWSDTQFPRIDDMDQLPITLFIRRGEQRRRCRLVVDNPGGGRVWRVGVRLHDAQRREAELVVGSTDDYTCSDRFSLEFD